ncbi:MAG: YmdB family metallophosphoesterase, partial [Candidatus Eremiobacteraeota bacterium]|nr:YmdB family metallophosphoesterase [Candidatus Eremiobacteraeota bacterium]
MRLLFFGDIVGLDATRLVARRLPEWREETHADIVVANVENALVSQWEDPRTSYGTDLQTV